MAGEKEALPNGGTWNRQLPQWPGPRPPVERSKALSPGDPEEARTHLPAASHETDPCQDWPWRGHFLTNTQSRPARRNVTPSAQTGTQRDGGASSTPVPTFPLLSFRPPPQIPFRHRA